MPLFSASPSAGEAHPHRGIIPPFRAGDPGIKLDAAARSILKQGKPYQTQVQDGSAGRGIVIQDIKAPVHVVWDRILDFGAYKKMVPKTTDSKIYRRQSLGNHQERIWVQITIGLAMLKLRFYVNHLYEPQKNSLTWTLDYDQKSDMDDSVGYWYVIPHPDNPTLWTRVFYSVQVSMFHWVPQFAVDFMSKQALTDATEWLKKHSELEASKQVPAGNMNDSNDATATKGGWFQRKGRKSSNKEQPEQNQVDKSKTFGLPRFALVSSVLAMSAYNIHLLISK